MRSSIKSSTTKENIVTGLNSRTKAKGTMSSVSSMSSTDGMTLIEVVVALGLLVVIMFFMSSTQLSSLKMNYKTGIIRELTQTAEREIENRRQVPESVNVITSFDSDCFFETEDYSCTTKVHPCSIVNNNVECVNTNQAAFPEAKAVAHQIVVDVVGPEQRNIRLQTILEADKASP